MKQYIVEINQVENGWFWFLDILQQNLSFGVRHPNQVKQFFYFFLHKDRPQNTR